MTVIINLIFYSSISVKCQILTDQNVTFTAFKKQSVNNLLHHYLNYYIYSITHSVEIILKKVMSVLK